MSHTSSCLIRRKPNLKDSNNKPSALATEVADVIYLKENLFFKNNFHTSSRSLYICFYLCHRQPLLFSKIRTSVFNESCDCIRIAPKLCFFLVLKDQQTCIE